MKKLMFVVPLLLSLAACGEDNIPAQLYMPAPPKELMTPARKLQTIKPQATGTTQKSQEVHKDK